MLLGALSMIVATTFVEIPTTLFHHWYVIGVVAFVTDTPNAADVPAGTLTLCGCPSMPGQVFTVTLNVQLTELGPYVAKQVTTFVPPGKAEPDGGNDVICAAG